VNKSKTDSVNNITQTSHSFNNNSLQHYSLTYWNNHSNNIPAALLY